MTRSPESADRSIEVLDEGACWTALSTADIGRLALLNNGDIDLFPVNFTVRDRTIYFRSTSGTKMVELTENPRVTFEADGVDTDGAHWSVVVKGSAARLTFDDEIEASGVRSLRSLVPADTWNYVRITPDVITGRRFAAGR